MALSVISDSRMCKNSNYAAELCWGLAKMIFELTHKAVFAGITAFIRYFSYREVGREQQAFSTFHSCVDNIRSDTHAKYSFVCMLKSGAAHTGLLGKLGNIGYFFGHGVKSAS